MLDPSWDTISSSKQRLLQFLSAVHNLVATKVESQFKLSMNSLSETGFVIFSKGKVKGKKMQNLVRGLCDDQLGGYKGGEFQNSKGVSTKLHLKPLSDVTSGLNAETVVLGKVVGSVRVEGIVPL